MTKKIILGLLLIAAIALVGCTNTIENKEDPLAGCTHYFDGCNTCTVTDTGMAICTEMFCEEPTEPRCLDKETSTEKPCTREYMPVCGEIEIQCITTPCIPVKETFSNRCMAENAGAENIVEGKCKSTEETFSIQSELKDCVGVGPQKCMVVNGNYFYDSIEGFEYEEGYNYEIKVNKELVEGQTPQDTSKYNYILIEVISKTPVEINLDTICTEEGGVWLEQYNECEYISKEICEDLDGRFNECASACRHDSEAGACTMQCVLVCEF